MQCQFCGFDNTEVGLREGRCNQCGSQLRWDDSSGEISPEVQAAVAAQAARIAPVAGAKPGADSADFKAVAAVLRNQNGGSSPRPAERNRAGDANHAVDEQHLEGHWRPGIDTEAHPLRTIKGVSTSTVSDLPVFIHPRAVRRPGDPEFGPSEYELLDVIGEGGVGIVYSARQSSIDRSVAVKMIKSSQQDNESTRDKFLAEAIVTGDLDHPNIVPVYDLGKDPNGALFYSMKRVAGTPWSAVLTRKPQAENLEILMKVSDAIAFAHARGVVHRDIKPENVMLGEFGEVLVMDWGIALPMASYRKSGGVLLSQGLGGTPAYMAPEMATGPLSKIGMASDVYLLGAVLYEIVTGTPPHRGADVMSCVLAAAKNEVAPSDKTGELMDIALRAMATKPEDRYGSVLEFQKEVRAYQSHLESVVLSERARSQLDTARNTESYDDYSRAVFAFEEAVTLWSGNESARRGQSESRLAFAECALDKGDFDLGLSQTDPSDPAHGDVIVRLRKALGERRARESRFRLMRAIALIFVTVTLIGGPVFTWFLYVEKQNSDSNRKKAVDASEAAEKNRDDAIRERGIAVTKGQEAVEAKTAAVKAREDAERDEDLAEEARYAAEVGVVNERINGNAFDVAREMLDSHRSSSKARLRHWEWGRMDYLANGGRSDQHVVLSVPVPSAEGTFETLAVSGDQRLVVTAENSGRVIVWSAVDGAQLGEFLAGHRIFALALSQDGQLLVTAGEGENASGVLKVWRRGEEGQFTSVKELASLRHRVISVALSPDGQRIAAGTNDREAFVWSWDSAAPRQQLPGHFDQVWSVAFSGDGERVATAGEDTKVRVWNANTAAILQVFSGHRSAVHAIAFSHRGDRIASGDYDSRVLVWPFDDSDSVAKQRRAEVAARLEPNPDESPDDKPLPKGTLQLQGHTGSVLAVGFSSDDSHLVTGSQDNTVRIWQVPASDQGRVAEIKTLRGHGGWVRAATLLGVDPSEFVVISGAMDRAWRRWNVGSYREVALLRGAIGSEGPVNRAMITPDGRAVIASREDGTVQIWNAATGQLAKTLVEGHEFLVSHAIVTPGNRELLTVAMDNSLRIWNLETGVEQRVLLDVGRRGIAASPPDGRFVLTGGPNKSARWWDIASGALIHRLVPHETESATAKLAVSTRPASTKRETPEITSLAVSFDGSLLFTGDGDGWCQLWDAKTGASRNRWNGHDWGITGAAFLPGSSTGADGATLLLTSSTDQTMRLWAITKNSQARPEVKAAFMHLDPVWSFAVSPDGSQAVTTSNLRDEKTGKKVPGLWLWDLASTKPQSQLSIAQAVSRTSTPRQVFVNTLTWSAEESDSILVSITDQDTSRQELWQWRPRTKTIEPAKLPASARGALWTALPINGGRQIITAGGKGARLWDTAKGRELMSFKPQGIVKALDVSRDGRWLVAAGSDGANGIAKLSSMPESLEETVHVRTLLGQPKRPFTAVAFAPNNEELVTGDGEGEIQRWRVSDGQRSTAAAFVKVASPLHDLRFSPDGRYLVAVSDDAVVRVFDVSSGEVQSMKWHSAAIRCAAISDDSRWLITGGDDRTAIIWDLSSRRLAARLEGHSAAIGSVAFSPDAIRVVTGSRDGTAKLWNLFPLARLADKPQGSEADPHKIKEALTLPPHAREVTAVGFAPNGQDILTSSLDSTVKIWLGEAVPPAIELGPGSISYRVGSPPKTIDDHAVVTCPSPVDDERLQLEIELHESDVEAGDSLSVISRPDETPLGRLVVRDGQVWLRPVGGDEERAIATFDGPSQGTTLKLSFAPNTAASLVQATLRSVAFASPDRKTAPAELRVRCRLSSSADPMNSTEKPPPPEERTIQVEANDG